jgi:hypothetical protein
MKKPYLHENQDKKRDDRGEKREKIYDCILIYFKK